jgi:hypothetical protein
VEFSYLYDNSKNVIANSKRKFGKQLLFGEDLGNGDLAVHFFADFYQDFREINYYSIDSELKKGEIEPYYQEGIFHIKGISDIEPTIDYSVINSICATLRGPRATIEYYITTQESYLRLIDEYAKEYDFSIFTKYPACNISFDFIQANKFPELPSPPESSSSQNTYDYGSSYGSIIQLIAGISLVVYNRSKKRNPIK